MKKNNVIFIICDELRADALGFMGNDIVKTPNIDRLAEDCTVFDKAYCACPMCAPSRASLATGRHVLSHGVYDNGTFMLEDEVSLYQVMNDHGYDTINIGKWHVNSLNAFGMQTNIKGVKCEDNKVNCFGIKDKELRKKANYKKMQGDISLVIHGERPVKPEETRDSLFTDEFIRRIESAKESGQPSFLRLSLFDPHSPYMPSKPYHDMYDYRDMELPENFNSDLSNKPIMHRLFHEVRGFKHLDEDDYRKTKACYYGLISHVDERVGRVIDKLKELDMYDDSIIVFTADHGSMMGEHGYIEKWGYMYEPVARIPFMIKLPKGDNTPERQQTYMENVDIMPTILDYLGIDVPDNVHGKSMMPLLRHETVEHKDEVYGFYYSGGFQTEPALMVRDDKFKFTQYPHQESVEKGMNIDHYLTNTDFFDGDLVGGELYDMEQDPNEVNNLYNDPMYRDMVAKYAKKIADWQDSLGPIADYDTFEPRDNTLAFFRMAQSDIIAKISKAATRGQFKGRK